MLCSATPIICSAVTTGFVLIVLFFILINSVTIEVLERWATEGTTEEPLQTESNIWLGRFFTQLPRGGVY